MFWCEEIAAKVSGPQTINDSKTPSGRVHVGALRGVLIHDAIFRTLKAHDLEARYLFGVDDYDPLDEIPAGKGDHFAQYLGQPLCNVPPPDGSSATDMAGELKAGANASSVNGTPHARFSLNAVHLVHWVPNLPARVKAF